ncbi:TPA: hypothetical protein DEW47_00510 [Patescibacteria group bacterium]|nr:MAG: hypothetical protein UT71_C0016G0019 [Parcubacteria group bacterium GW2011_GWF2_40_10]KKR46794.1 MAG: hypothetical protein UT83_C0018G0019 [Parcubacteria group bacterium GW2011_GWA2_40_143]KKR59698.1 MAG: hypothetical protein UT97_C0013G0019 [Parcubacteria group bacterium GW2011_GWC2_40_31]KKR74591.1 MAG: hypothetical protein UU18_C0023G0019 [Parcubacteria group bacterium GW2011_GWB2_40_8]KKR80707.1 MAG: hypothetical protein UU28_C0034G0018 [Parcubacteria group bacterium GW2011_GWD2_40_
MQLFGKNKIDKKVLILDIGGASAGSAVAVFDKSGEAKIISYARKPVNFLFDVNLDASLRCALNTITKLLERSHQEVVVSTEIGNIDYVMCVFSSPWFVSQTKEVLKTEKESFEVTDDVLVKLLEEEGKVFKEKHPLFFGNNKGESVEILEHNFMKVELNGYHTDQSIGKKAKTLKSYLYLSLGLRNAVDKFKKEISKFFPNVPIYFKTAPYVTFGSLYSITNIGTGFCVVNTGGETTDLYVVRDSYVDETITFPRGVNSFYRSLSKEFNITPREAVSMFASVLRGHRLESDYEKVKMILDKALLEWADFFEKALKQASETKPLPIGMFLMSSDIMSSFFKEAVEQKHLAYYTEIGKPFKVADINAKWFMPHMPIKKDSNGKGIESDDTLMMELFFAKKFF